ncbi:MAG TPA: histidine phosphatase family protein [Candidatus Dormibacteraeota bacterium]|jgi:broad specificity phosphatase PhoE|nr:histidine phosphatase family protein [Candidatus Dormibacteraeota bacterium]
MAEAGSNFLQALDALHRRFLVGVEGVTEVWLVRHGDAYAELVSADDHITDSGAGRRMDPPLSPQGRREAAQLNQRLRHSGIDAVYASDLARARETAEIAALGTGLEVRVEPRLREIRTHWDEGGPRPMPGDDAPVTRYIPFHQRDLDDAVVRMTAALRDVAAEVGPGRRAVCVSHAAAITAYLLSLMKLEWGAFRLLVEFTSVSVVRFKDDLVVVHSIGDTGHLVRESLPAEVVAR